MKDTLKKCILPYIILEICIYVFSTALIEKYTINYIGPIQYIRNAFIFFSVAVILGILYYILLNYLLLKLLKVKITLAGICNDFLWIQLLAIALGLVLVAILPQRELVIKTAKISFDCLVVWYQVHLLRKKKQIPAWKAVVFSLVRILLSLWYV